MSWWMYAKQFPKYALVFGIIIGSTALFACWWVFRSRPKTAAEVSDDTAARAATQQKAAQAEARIDYLFLADDDLYDAETGECLFKNWLRGDHPVKLFYDQATRKIIGQYNEGFVRYTFDGNRDAVMMRQEPPAFVPGSKRIFFIKDKNVWQADLDWRAFKFTSEKQVTTMGVFYQQHFAENVQLLTDKTLVVRNSNELLRVDLETGNVKPSRLPMNDIGRRRSPDSRWVAGVLNGQFYCYDVDADTTKTISVGRNGLSEIQWLGNDKCLGLANQRSVFAYDRLNQALAEICSLPFSCFKMGEPSFDGRFIFCAGGLDIRNGALVDLEKKTAVPVKGGAGITWVSNDTFAYSRDVPDSDWRGTWLQTTNYVERRITTDPCLLSKASLQLVILQGTNSIIFRTQRGLARLKWSDNGTCSQLLVDKKIILLNGITNSSPIFPTMHWRPDSS